MGSHRGIRRGSVTLGAQFLSHDVRTSRRHLTSRLLASPALPSTAYLAAFLPVFLPLPLTAAFG
jgi:hypothetical protein